RDLHHGAARAELERADDFVAIDVEGEENRPDVRASCGDSPQRENAGLVRPGEVEQQDVRLKLLNQLDRFLDIARLACDRQIWLGLEQLAEALPKEGLLGGDHNADCIGRTIHHRLKLDRWDGSRTREETPALCD